MGFLDKARAAADDFAAKADGMMGQAGISTPSTTSGETEALLRDLGVLAYLEASGREASATERDRVMTALRSAEERGGLTSFALRTAPPPAPGTVGGSSQTTGYAAPPPPSGPGATGGQGTSGGQGISGGSVPPPPPPTNL